MGNSSRRYSIVISEQALEMLVSHTRFLAKVSNEAAEKLIKAFERAAESLQIMPERNPWLETGICRLIIQKDRIRSPISVNLPNK
jgi:plasmid stabilization system protein ParE